ncbi:MAG: YggT family protein [Clostridia bacterium]
MILGLIRSIVHAVVYVYELVLIARAISSWLPINPDNQIMSLLYTITEPVLMPVRSLLQRIPMLANFPIDFSIIVVFMLLAIIRALF